MSTLHFEGDGIEEVFVTEVFGLCLQTNYGLLGICHLLAGAPTTPLLAY